MTTHHGPEGAGGEFDPERDSEHDGSDEDLSSREETTESTSSKDPAWLSDDELEAHVLHTVQRMNVLEAELAAGVAELDRRSVPDRKHVLTTKQWLRHACRMSASRAATILRVGRALEEMPAATDHARSGSITPDGLRMLAAARHDHPHEFADHEAVLADAATYLGSKDLRRAIDHWKQQVAYPGALGDIDDAKRRRRISCNRTWDGMWSVSGLLDPESGHVLDTALRARSAAANLDPSDDRTPGQRTADALVDVCRFSLDHDDTLETSGGAKPHITVDVDFRTIAATGDEPDGRLPEVDGMPITPEDARRLACDGGIVRMITDGPSRILDVGRSTRTIPAAIRRAVERRDRGCAWTGCDALTSWCDVHHVHHWAHGGETSLDNLLLLCRRHHTAIHEGRSPP